MNIKRLFENIEKQNQLREELDQPTLAVAAYSIGYKKRRNKKMRIKVNGTSYKWNGKRLLVNILKGLTFLAITGFYSWLLCQMMLALINR